MSQLNNLQIKLFLNLNDSEVAEVLENIEGLQHIETFKELKKEILIKYESQKILNLWKKELLILQITNVKKLFLQ